MRSPKDNSDPLAKEEAPPFGEPEDPPPPPWYIRLREWYLKPATKVIKRDRYGQIEEREVSLSTSGRRIRIVAFILAAIHAAVGLPLLWVAVFTWSERFGNPGAVLSSLAAVFALVGFLTYLADSEI